MFHRFLIVGIALAMIFISFSCGPSPEEETVTPTHVQTPTETIPAPVDQLPRFPAVVGFQRSPDTLTLDIALDYPEYVFVKVVDDHGNLYEDSAAPKAGLVRGGMGLTSDNLPRNFIYVLKLSIGVPEVAPLSSLRIKYRDRYWELPVEHGQPQVADIGDVNDWYAKLANVTSPGKWMRITRYIFVFFTRVGDWLV